MTLMRMASVVLMAGLVSASLPALARDRVSLYVDPACPKPGETMRLWATVEARRSTFVPGAEHVLILGRTVQFTVDLLDEDAGEDEPHDSLVAGQPSVVVDVAPIPAGSYQVQLRVRRVTPAGAYSPAIVEDTAFVHVRDGAQACAARRIVSGGESMITARVGESYSSAFVIELTDAQGRPTDGNITLHRVFREIEIGSEARPDAVDVELHRIARGHYEARGRANAVPGTFLYRAQLADVPEALSAQSAYFVVSHRPGPDAIPLVPVVQYVNRPARRYFMTADVEEMAKLDAGREWRRTGDVFLAYGGENAPGVTSATPVCRFHGRAEAGLHAHFFSPSPDECDAVARHGGWRLETRNAFAVVLPDTVTGACPHHMRPIYRAFSNRPDGGHIYATAPWLLNVSEYPTGAWIREGYGPDAVAFCVPA